jgi:hypothetical protein
MAGTRFFDYYDELDDLAWLDPEQIPEVWFDKDMLDDSSVAAAAPPRELVALQAVNRAGAF